MRWAVIVVGRRGGIVHLADGPEQSEEEEGQPAYDEGSQNDSECLGGLEVSSHQTF